jgi:hypothetical protein
VDAAGTLVRHHRGSLWITCVTEFRDWRQPLAAAGRWTPVFFLDDAVALAAGHRPCGFCRRPAYLAYQEAVTRAAAGPAPVQAVELNRRLAAERLRRGRGVDRAGDRRLWTAGIETLPAGAVVVDRDRTPRLVLDDRLLAFGFEGWGRPVERPRHGAVEVLTPPTSVAALRHGYVAVLHPSSAGPSGS